MKKKQKILSRNPSVEKKTSLKMQGSNILKRHSEWYRTKLGLVTKQTRYNTLGGWKQKRGILKKRNGSQSKSIGIFQHLKSNSASELTPHLLHHPLIVQVGVPDRLAAIRRWKCSQSQGVFLFFGRSRRGGRVGAEVGSSEGHFEGHLTVSRKPLWDSLGPRHPGLASLQEG